LKGGDTVSELMKKILTDKSIRTDEEAVKDFAISSADTFGPWLNEA